MKNIKRLVLLIALILVAGKVLFSDFEIFKTKNNATAAVVSDKGLVSPN